MVLSDDIEVKRGRTKIYLSLTIWLFFFSATASSQPPPPLSSTPKGHYFNTACPGGFLIMSGSILFNIHWPKHGYFDSQPVIEN